MELRRDPIDCWGRVLSGRECRAGNFSPVGQGPFYTHFCAACQQLGIEVPACRIQMLPPCASIANSASNGVWSVHHRLPRYRIINQTKRCRGPAAVIFECPPSPHQIQYLQNDDQPGAPAC